MTDTRKFPSNRKLTGSDSSCAAHYLMLTSLVMKIKTGTDINLCACRAEGYPVVEHGKRPLDPVKDYRLTISNPEAWTDSGKVRFGHSRIYHTDTLISYSDLWKAFERGGKGIKSFCDFENCPLPSPTENPCFLDFVQLASTVSAYSGIE